MKATLLYKALVCAAVVAIPQSELDVNPNMQQNPEY
jgi:hypothetical protein